LDASSGPAERRPSGPARTHGSLAVYAAGIFVSLALVCLSRVELLSGRADGEGTGPRVDLVRRNRITPKAIREMVEIIDEDIRLRAARQGLISPGENARVRRVEREDANVRRALRTATPRAAERT
jgi:hypothetical protein